MSDDPPLRELVWPESGLESRYGEGESGAKTLICLSCHVFREGAVVSGDKGDARNLLARSGNPVEWAEGGENNYLCLGCHGVNPTTGDKAGGHTHPLMEADAARLGRAVAGAGERHALGARELRLLPRAPRGGDQGRVLHPRGGRRRRTTTR